MVRQLLAGPQRQIDLNFPLSINAMPARAVSKESKWEKERRPPNNKYIALDLSVLRHLCLKLSTYGTIHSNQQGFLDDYPAVCYCCLFGLKN